MEDTTTDKRRRKSPYNPLGYKRVDPIHSRRVQGSYDGATEPVGIVYPSAGYPTTYPPGSVAKYFVMMRRYDRGEGLFHPYDAKYEYDPLPLMFALIDKSDRRRVVLQQRRQHTERVSMNELHNLVV